MWHCGIAGSCQKYRLVTYTVVQTIGRVRNPNIDWTPLLRIMGATSRLRITVGNPASRGPEGSESITSMGAMPRNNRCWTWWPENM